MEQSPTIIGRYLHMTQEILINSIYQDRATDPWSAAVFDPQSETQAWTGPSKPYHDDRPGSPPIAT